MIDRRSLILLAATNAFRTACIADDQDHQLNSKSLLLYPDHPGYKIFRVRTPGSYHLSSDETQKSFWGGGHTGPKGGFMFRLYCGNIDINMRGHEVGAKLGVSGFSLSPKHNIEFHKTYPKDFGEECMQNGNVSIINGKMDFSSGDGSGIIFCDTWDEPQYWTGVRQAGECGRDYRCLPKNVKYLRNNYRFERLTIVSDDIAMAIEGGHTMIRDCIIESAGNAAIFIAGPNVMIENCEIRLKPLASGSGSANSPMRAAIVLHDASNAVIRNNRIRIDTTGGLPSDTHCILVHDGATNVTVRDNTFINLDGMEPVTLTSGGDVALIGNKSEHRWWPR